MINIQITTDGEHVFDSIKASKTTLVENALVIRRLEEIKQQLLSFEYEHDIEVSHNEDEDEEDKKEN